MRVIKESEHSILLNNFELSQRYYLATTVLVCFDLLDLEKLVPEQDFWPPVIEILGQDAVLDQGMPKPRGEVLAAGSCYAPKGQVRTAAEVRVGVGGIEKRLNVYGNRYWKGQGEAFSIISDPEPFAEIPLNWANAFGGREYDKNPLGLGIDPAFDESGKMIYPLPNVEDPRYPIGSLSDRPEPAGLGPYAVEWPQRSKKLGTYDQKWFNERWPYYPDDLDHTFFNTAPDDQQTDSFFRGDERIEVLNMHPEHQFIGSKLPGVRIRCFWTVAPGKNSGPEDEEFREVKTRIDTVWLFPAILKGIALFRASAEVADDEYSDVQRCFIATEKMDEPPGSLEHYLELERKKQDLEIPVDTSQMEAAQKELDAAMKQVSAIPRMLEEAKNRALGKAPTMPSSPKDAAPLAASLSNAACAQLDDAEKQLLSLKKQFGHLVKIDISDIPAARAALKDAAAQTAEAAEESEKALSQARTDMAEAKEEMKKQANLADRKDLKVDPKYLEGKTVDPETMFPEEEVNLWHERGFEFVVECRKNLENDQETIDALRKLGLDEDIIEQAWLGVNPEQRTCDPGEWGLEPEEGDAAESEPLVIPRGFVIPHFDGEELDRLTIRCGNLTDSSSDYLVKGSKDTPLLLGFGENKPVVQVSEELEAWLFYQEAWDSYYCICLADPGKLEDPEIKKFIESAPAFLITSPGKVKEE